MRISPVGYYYDDLEYVLKTTRQATVPSHNNKEAIKGAQAVASTIYLARNNFSKEEIDKQLRYLPNDEQKDFVNSLYDKTGKENLMEKSYKANYIINNEKFDLKQITGSGKYVIEGNLKKKKKQMNC